MNSQTLALALIKTQYEYTGQQGNYVGAAQHHEFFRSNWRNLRRNFSLTRINFLDALYFKLYLGLKDKQNEVIDFDLHFPNLSWLEKEYLKILDQTAKLVNISISFRFDTISIYYQQGEDKRHVYKFNSCRRADRDGYILVNTSYTSYSWQNLDFIVGKYLVAN